MTAAAVPAPPPSEVWRRQDAVERATGVNVCPAGWPRPRLDDLPLPWITPILDGVAYWTQIHGGRLLRCQQQWLCQVCGLALPPQVLVLADADGELVTDAGMHPRCALLSLTVCEGLSPRLLLAAVTRADLRYKGHPLAEQPSTGRQRWQLASRVRAAAARVGTPAAAHLLESHRYPPAAAPALSSGYVPEGNRP